MTGQSASDYIRSKVLSWEGVTEHPHRFGGVEFRIGKCELGHLHGDVLTDIPFPKKTRDDLIMQGKASVHYFLPESGWVSRHLKTQKDVEQAAELFRIAFDLAQRKFK